MKQTAVECLFENLIQLNADMKYTIITWEEYLLKRSELLEQAKAMEKEQIMDAYRKGYIHYLPQVDSEQYYNETFKSE